MTWRSKSKNAGWWLSGMSAAPLLGCRPSPEDAPVPSLPAGEEALSRISAELTALGDLLSGTTILAVVAMLLAAAVAFIFLSRLASRFRRRHRLGSPEITAVYLLLSAILLGCVAVALFQYLFIRVPVVATVTAASAAAGLGFVLFRHLPAWVSGFALVVQRRVREGDLLQTGDVRGVLERVGLFRMVLVNMDGARVHLSIAELGRRPLTISSPTKEHVVEHIVVCDAPATSDDIENVRAMAVLCPYRSAKSKVRIEILASNPSHIRVHFHSWSEEANQRAHTYLSGA